jgi:GNAT superfamily N-acetyltransferase
VGPAGRADNESIPSPTVAQADVEIVRAGSEELDELTDLFEAYLDFYHMPLDRARSRTFLETRLREGESVIFAARRRGRLVGFVQLYPLFSSTRVGPLWLLNDLYVDASVRRGGVATLLLERSKGLARDTGAVGIELETAIDNPAQRLYEARGWKRDLEFFHYSWERSA